MQRTSMLQVEATSEQGATPGRRFVSRRLLIGSIVVLLAVAAGLLIQRVRRRALERPFVGVWTKATEPEGESDRELLEFRPDGYFRSYPTGKRESESSYMGWHVSRGRLVLTGGNPSYTSTSLGGRIKEEARELGQRFELGYVARWDVQFEGDDVMILVPHSGDAGEKRVKLVRVGKAPSE